MDGKTFLEIGRDLVATIVSSYVKHNKVAADDISALIASVRQSLSKLGDGYSSPATPRMPAVAVRQSVWPDYVVCLECGFRSQTLRRHLSTRHGLDRIAYLARWNLRADYPLTAPNYSMQRSDRVRKIGLGRGRRVAKGTPSSLRAPAI
jgi:predicted transcriptional regulator